MAALLLQDETPEMIKILPNIIRAMKIRDGIQTCRVCPSGIIPPYYNILVQVYQLAECTKYNYISIQFESCGDPIQSPGLTYHKKCDINKSIV